MSKLVYIWIAVFLLAACAKSATPDPNQVAHLVQQAVQATLAAQATQRPTAMPTATAVQPKATTVPRTAPTDTPLPPPTATPAPTETPTIELTPTPTQGPEVSTARAANLRAGPGTNYPVIGTTKPGDTYAILGRNDDGIWFEICCVNEQPAWIAAAVVNTNGAVGNVEVAQNIPTPPPTAPAVAQVPTPTPDQVATGRDLQVSFINPRYNCMQRELEYEATKGITQLLWGYRMFQVDLYITNNSTEPVNPPWKVKRWIITNGTTEGVNDLVWQWTSRNGDLYQQPVIQPGQQVGWTFVGFPVARNEWVKAVEFEWKGQVYRQGFDLGPYGNAYDYRDCGLEHDHWDRPTPTPRP